MTPTAPSRWAELTLEFRWEIEDLDLFPHFGCPAACPHGDSDRLGANNLASNLREIVYRLGFRPTDEASA